MEINKVKLYEKIKDYLNECYPKEEIYLESTNDDLGIDSLDLAELEINLTEEYDIEIEIDGCKSVNDLVELVYTKLIQK